MDKLAFLEKALETVKQALYIVAYEFLVTVVIHLECKRLGILLNDDQAKALAPVVLILGGFLYWYRALDRDRLLAYDQLFHDRVMNPLIESIQAWQHVNRYDMLRYAITIEYGTFQTGTVLWALQCAMVGKWVEFPARTVVGGAFIFLYRFQFSMLGGLEQMLDECTTASARYEAGTLVGMPLNVKEFCGSRKVARRIVLLLLLMRVLVGHPEFVNIPVWWAHAFVGDATLLVMLFIGHIANADDLHPRDRVNLLDGKDVRIP
jgi:hypothetical protein